MTTCKDCIQYDVCEYADNLKYADEESLKRDCPRFKNKADFVEVVRCEKCKYAEENECIITGTKSLFCLYKVNVVSVEPTHYCAYGERKEK